MELRDEVVAFIARWHEKTKIPKRFFIKHSGLSYSKYHQWVDRKGIENQHNAPIPKSHWILNWERAAILDYYCLHPQEGYRRLTYMMIDQNIVAVSPSSVYRVLKDSGVLGRRKNTPTLKGTGFEQPLEAHEHWHIDVSYLNISGTFYYMASILDGYSRFIIHFEIREAMKEKDIEIILQRAKEKYPYARPRIISDNGPQFIAKDFKEYIRLTGMTHVRTSPFYPQSNGKIERYHQSIKKECIRPKAPTNLGEARASVTKYIEHYNNERLHSAIGYIAPIDKLKGKEQTIFKDRKEKLRMATLARVQKAA